MTHGGIEQKALILVRGPAMHPAFVAALSAVNARVYNLSPPEILPQESLNRLYATFLHTLCGQEFSIFVSHTISDPGVRALWDPGLARLSDFVARMRQVEPSVEFTGPASGRIGLFRRQRREPEMTMRTNRLEALQLLLEQGDVWIAGEEWILDRPTIPFPLEAFRRRNTPGGEDAALVWQYMVRDFVAFVRIVPDDGPTIMTFRLDEARVVFAARQAADAIGRPLTLGWDERIPGN
jgi:hypothetical protein